MMRLSVTKFILLTIIVLSSLSGYSQKINHYQKNNLELIYFGNRYSYLMPHVVGTYENAFNFHKKYWNYHTSTINVVLSDFSDIGYGGAIAIPRNNLSIGIEPYSFAFSIIPSSERFQWLFNHELTHIVMADKPNKADETWRKIFFGKINRDEQYPVSALWSYLTTPRWYAPRWYHEGIACFMETWMSGGLGRAMGGYDEMYFRSIVAGKKPIYSNIGLETEGTTIDFQVGSNSYLYGTRFVDYLAYVYGTDKLKSFFVRTDSSKTFYGNQFKKVYQKPISKVWKEWIKFESGFQQQNISQIAQYPLTPFQPITKKELGNVSRYGYNPATKKMYAALNFPGEISQISEIDLRTGKIRKLADLDSPSLYYSTHLAYDPDKNRVFISEQNSTYRSLVQIDGKSGKKKTLIRYSRTGELVYNRTDHSLWGIKHDNGYSILVKIPEPYNTVIPMYSAEFGKSLFDLAISNDGKKLTASLTGVRGEMSLIMFSVEDLEVGKKKFETIRKLEDNTLTQFQFSPNDKYLIGSSYYTGVSNIWRISLEDTSRFELLSNTETGFFMPLQYTTDSLLVLKFQRDGMIPGTIPIKVINDANSIEYLGNWVSQKNPEVKDWSLGAPNNQSDSSSVHEGAYLPWKELKLNNAYPDISGFKNTIAVGYRLNFSDPSGINSIDLFLGTSPWSAYKNNQKIHAQFEWKYWSWTLSASYNKTNFYDLFGPTKRSRAGYSVGLNYNRVFSTKKPLKYELDFSAATYGNLEFLPQYQNIATPIRNIQEASASFSVEKLRKTLGAIDDEKGYQWKLNMYGILAGGSLFPTIESHQSIGLLIPKVRNTSFWIRNSIGQSLGDRSSALSKSYFGGFRNNYVDWQPSEQYRLPMAFPGTEIDEISAWNYVKTLGELNLKPIRLRNVGTSFLYPTYLKSSLFGTHLLTDFDKKDQRRNFFNAGIQVDLQLVLFSYMKTTWSAGYAMPFEKRKESKGQFMFSVKLLGF
ncbi:MAG TPA: hypothetical protein PLB87_03935 [Prolixibacteraceae bacterium]|nr:hypothetical protein [Prolixibacteraceae bacterium]